MVSSKRITPLMNSPAPGAVNSISRYARRVSSVDSSLMLLKRLRMVLVLSSAAKSPRCFATMAFAVAASSAVFMTDGSRSSGNVAVKDNKTLLGWNSEPKRTKIVLHRDRGPEARDHAENGQINRLRDRRACHPGAGAGSASCRRRARGAHPPHAAHGEQGPEGLAA